MQHLDRDTARALVDAGYMSPKDYVDMFAAEAANEPTAAVLELGHHRTRQWTIPAHFARSMRPIQYRIAVNKRYSAA